MWRKEARICGGLWEALVPGGTAHCRLSTSSGEDCGHPSHFSLQDVMSQNDTDSCGGARLQKGLSFSILLADICKYCVLTPWLH